MMLPTVGVEMPVKRQAQGPPQSPPTPEFLAYSNSPEILTITGVFFALSFITVFLRCYVRTVMLGIMGPDDFVMILAMVCTTATFVCFVIETQYGLGKHFLAIMADPQNMIELTKTNYAHAIIVMIGVSTVKVSIALSLLRLSPRKIYSRFLWGIIIFVVVMTLGCALSLIFQCIPVQAAWDTSLRPPPVGHGAAKCYTPNTFRNIGLMNSSFNIITDVLFATLPIPLIWKLQLNIRTKISLIGILSLGWFACAAAIIKAIQQWHVLGDPDWTVHDSFNVWNFMELAIGVIAGSLPSLKPLFNWFLKTARGITSSGKSRKGGVTGYNGPTSLGYQDMQSGSGRRSIALRTLTNHAGSPTDNNPYDITITTQRQKPKPKDPWDIESPKISDESISPLQSKNPGQRGILMTREVQVTEG